ncbi:MAG: protein kinase [Alphaproteobacteria bacterium]|nr:protein kinase [Alphaproteobacteria bacterium]MCB9698513.1 protein kinase [Alphaproteobacteria bacterium]
MPVVLGPFLLERPLGRGGMGTVWRGRHVTEGVDVAVKVLTREGSEAPDVLAAFRSEVRAVAGLRHPNVVWVIDHGTVDDQAAAASGGELRRGTPYLAMELADGSLSSRVGSCAWPELRATLLALLDALAHAHARGVIHRDLKPGNVLIGGERPGLKLADFGLAHAADASGAPTAPTLSGGTPSYMAPEQWENRVRDFGPWTDLYALGCVAWKLSSGAVPISKRGWAAMMMAVLRDRPARLVPTTPLPEGFEDWLLTLLEKDPGRRYACAADAAWALQQLEEPRGTASASARAAGEEATVLRPPAPQATTLVFGTPEAVGAGVVGVARHPLPPMPPTWRRGTAAPDPRHLLGAGLGLYGLRALGLVDREAERDVLWQALRAVTGGRGPRAVVLRGAAGRGKSRLAAWLVERAAEVGAATSLRANHGPTPGPTDGWVGMCERAFGCTGLERVGERVRPAMTELGLEADADAMVSLLRPDEGSLRFERPAQRHALLGRWMAARAERRPVVLWIDDVQWGPDTLALADHVLRKDARVLILVTARDEALGDRASALEAFGGDRARTLEVGPLPPQHRRALVEQLLGLEGGLAAEVEERTGGNPLFAVQLVGDWVERGLLVPGPTGFVRREGTVTALPDDLHAVWTARVERVVDGRPDRGSALEVAAALGGTVRSDVWALAVRELGLAPDGGLLDALLAAGLAVATDEGWDPVHGMLRESLLRRAREAGRLTEVHRACARALTRLGNVADRGRVGLHWLEAGDAERAVPPLLEVARATWLAAEHAEVGRWIDAAARALDLAQRPEVDPDRVRLALLRASMARVRGRLDEAEALASGAQEVALAGGWLDLCAAASFELGFGEQMRGRVQPAIVHLRRSIAQAEDAGEEAQLAVSTLRLALVLVDAAQLDQAEVEGTRALAAMEAAGRQLGAGNALVALAGVALRRGDLGRATALARRAQGYFERSGSRLALADAHNYLGEVVRMAGALEEAEDHYRCALRLYTELGASDALMARINLALVQMARADFGGAERELRVCLEACGARRQLVAVVRVFLARCAADDGRWPEVTDHLEAGGAALAETGFVDPDVGRCLEELAAVPMVPETVRARAAELARTQAPTT